MPVPLSYPGVYIEEIPSGVRTITGVATSIAAFVGWAPKGSTREAERILSWQDFERVCGGLDVRSLLGYAVYDFFQNGGQDAYVVRLAATNAAAASVALAPLTLAANGPASSGNNYGIVIKARTDPPTTSRFPLAVVYLN